MKKIFSTLAVLSVISVMTAVPKVAHADTPCEAIYMCDNIVVVCDPYDYVIWDEIYCGLDEE